MADEILIEAVRSFPCLWQVSNRSYKDIKARENAWKAVADQVKDLSVEDCTKRWKGLRDKFVRELKKVKHRKTGEAGPVYISCWAYFNALLFLEDSVRHKPTTSNFNVKQEIRLNESSFTSESSSGASSPSIDLTSQPASICSEDLSLANTPIASPSTPVPSPKRPAKKRKTMDEVDQAILESLKVYQNKQVVEETKEEDLFGKEVAVVLKRLQPREKAMAKLQIQQVLLKCEFPPSNPSNYTDTWTQ